MSSRRGLPDDRKMRHDRHFVEELANQSVTEIGMMVPVDRIETNKEQPRTNLGDITELAASVKQRGVLEPLIVRRLPGASTFQLIAGERRLHAAIAAGLSEVPCVEMAVSDQEALELALVENLQRKDLSPFEEADGYRTLVEKYGYTHAQVAASLGRSRPTVTETLRLLTIPPAIRDLCRHADITAKSLLLLVARAGSTDRMEQLVQEIAESSLDREAARSVSQEVRSGEDGPATHRHPAANDDPAGDTRFRPIHVRYREAPDAAIHVSLSIRRRGVSRAELVATLERLLERLRSGELDERLGKRSPKPPE